MHVGKELHVRAGRGDEERAKPRSRVVRSVSIEVNEETWSTEVGA